MRWTSFLSALSLLGLVVWFSGCGREGGPAPASPPAAAKPAAASEGDPAEGLKQLDAADRKLAEKQKVCPVSGELSARWASPTRSWSKAAPSSSAVTAAKPELKAHPDKYLKKLEK